MVDDAEKKLLADVGRRIRETRAVQGLSLEQLARLVCYHAVPCRPAKGCGVFSRLGVRSAAVNMERALPVYPKRRGQGSSICS